VQAAADAGAGELALESGDRSYATQSATYAGHVADRGVEGADLVSARPGFSEHQSGLTVDVVPCDEASCATIDDLAASPQGAWIAEHAWEHGWIVRYTEGRTDVTGYAPEPWHLRYIGVDLARAYHEGGWTTLEEFFGLPAAPGYAE
jgi:D-alanyl-D-alanine carboxypeptidase